MVDAATVLSLLVGLIGLVIGLIVFWPSAGVSSGATLDPSEPFATPFAFKNEGFSGLTNLSVACAIQEANPPFPRMESINGGIVAVTTPNLLKGKTLSSKESVEFFCPIGDSFKPPKPFTAIDINLYATYSISYIPFKSFTSCYRFDTRPDSDGRLRWLQKGFDQPCRWPATRLNFVGPTKR